MLPELQYWRSFGRFKLKIIVKLLIFSAPRGNNMSKLIAYMHWFDRLDIFYKEYFYCKNWDLFPKISCQGAHLDQIFQINFSQNPPNWAKYPILNLSIWPIFVNILWPSTLKISTVTKTSNQLNVLLRKIWNIYCFLFFSTDLRSLQLLRHNIYLPYT